MVCTVSPSEKEPRPDILKTFESPEHIIVTPGKVIFLIEEIDGVEKTSSENSIYFIIFLVSVLITSLGWGAIYFF